MGHVAFASPDPRGAARDLVEVVGLRITDQTTDAIYLSSNNRQHEVSFHRGDKAGVRAMGLEAVSPQAVDEAYKRAKTEGLTILDDRPLSPHYQRAVRVVAPGGGIIEVHTPIARTAPARYVGPGARPRRLEHVNMLVPDTAALGDFCSKVLGMRLSDQTDGGALRWYRCEDGHHHSIAMGPGPGKLHHYAFDHHAMEDLLTIADTLVLKNRALLWGPGRHGPGDNIFTYFVDPNGCVVENSIEMYRIDNDAVYEPRSWDISEGLRGRWINLWGTPPPPTFSEPGIVFEAEPVTSRISTGKVSSAPII
jgi:catechol 2,3-dioxygenase-like lactoylglutathione lyase family enzyme